MSGNSFRQPTKVGCTGDRTCARAGCDARSAYTLVFDYSRAEAWLCELWGEPGQGAYDLCVTHAERFSVPRGWTFLDRRRVAQPLFGEPVQGKGEVEEWEHPGPRQATA